ncbi:plasma alpha-L-fucosidase [Geospiza fortis]|uniref:alpha-L-fucosidase n=1 Tax=Geospiza fortis TaxID=48883 RepID=A0A6I9HFX7_GEOFO|nr:plasma alpha-L-fucosidase [Geospiza fortis]
MLHPVLLGRTGEAEPAVGSRREGQTQQAARERSGRRSKARARLRPQIQRTPSGRSCGEESAGRGKTRRDVGRGISQLLPFLKILKIQGTVCGRAARWSGSGGEQPPGGRRAGMVWCPPGQRRFGLEPLCRLTVELRCLGSSVSTRVTDSMAQFAEEVEFEVLLLLLLFKSALHLRQTKTLQIILVQRFNEVFVLWYWQKEKREPYVKFMDANYPPGFSYEDFGPLFTAEFFDPNQWADILKASGAKYVVLTSKHHEGFTLWGSKYSWNWNAVDVGPKRDLVAELATSVRNRTDLHFGLYHSLFEWFNPLFLEDATNAFNTSKFPTSKSLPELYEIVTKYQPEIIWSDGDGNAPDTYWNSTGFLAWLYNDSPVRDTVVTNDRWGAGSICAHGGFYTCSDRYTPGRLLPHKWENCMTIDRGSWGYRRDARLRDYLPIEDLVKQLVETVSCGGNLLMNIGPTHDGRIAVVFEERLRQVGSWLEVNGEAIYGTKPWRAQNDTVTPGVWYTFTPKEGKVNAIFLNWPVSRILELGEPRAKPGETQVKLAGYRELLKWVALGEKGMVIALPQLTPQQMPCQWGWTLQLTDVD